MCGERIHFFPSTFHDNGHEIRNLFVRIWSENDFLSWAENRKPMAKNFFTAQIKYCKKLFPVLFNLHLNELMIAFSREDEAEEEHRLYDSNKNWKRKRKGTMRMHERDAFETWHQLYGQISNKHVSRIECMAVWLAGWQFEQ